MAEINKLKQANRFQLRIDNIVAKAFLPASDKTFLCHLDKNNINCRIENLQWMNIDEYLSRQFGGVWKEIALVPKYYVSTKGQIWSSSTEQLIRQQCVADYPSVNIGYPKPKFQHVHRFVAMAFCPNPENKPQVNHKDLDHDNCNSENLEWVTQSENIRHSIRMRVKEKKIVIPVIEKKELERKEIVNDDEPPIGIELEQFLGYIITEDGRVYSHYKNKILKPQLNGNDYYRITISDKTVYIHHLVAQAYLPPKKPEEEIDHINGNRTDNRACNLRWCNRSENRQNSLQNNPKQLAHLQKRVIKLDRDTEQVIEEFNGVKEASRKCSVNSGSIVKACKGQKPTAGGFKWKYAEENN